MKKRKVNPVTKLFVKLLGNEKYQAITIPVFAILISLIVGAAVIAALGKDPVSAYTNLLQGCGLWPKPKYAGGKSMATDFFSFLNYWTPMIFASLAVAVALKAGLFNIGVSGQMLAAGFVSTVLIGYSSLAAPIAKPLVVIIAALVGGLVGAFMGWLKYKFNINEVVSSIMLNYIVQYVVAFFINTKFVDPVSRQSKNVSDAARLTLMGTEIGGFKYDIPLGIVLAIVVALVIKFVLDKTTFGYEIATVGLNRKAAQYAGINVGRKMILYMLISGGLAGLAGATYYLGYFSSIQPKVLSATGFDAIAVSLLGNSHPLGILLSSFLISIMGKGKTYMSSSAGLDAEIASVITGLILLFSACGAFIRYKVKRAKDNMAEIEKANKAEVNE
ncbi:MAG: ABC transporter permease [Oscillospiraceae bacterium]|nr:ABC transporter permease [Oscillospiraceae bacterium]